MLLFVVIKYEKAYGAQKLMMSIIQAQQFKRKYGQSCKRKKEVIQTIYEMVIVQTKAFLNRSVDYGVMTSYLEVTIMK